MSATSASRLSFSASTTSCGFCQASRLDRRIPATSARDRKSRARARAAPAPARALQARRKPVTPPLMLVSRCVDAPAVNSSARRPWSLHVANLARAAFWLALLAIVLTQAFGSRGIDKASAGLLGRFEEERKSRVIAMIHREESTSLFGVPVAGSVSIDPSGVGAR